MQRCLKNGTACQQECLWSLQQLETDSLYCLSAGCHNTRKVLFTILDIRHNFKALSMWYRAEERQRHVFESSRCESFYHINSLSSSEISPFIFSTPASVTLHTAVQLRLFAQCVSSSSSQQTDIVCMQIGGTSWNQKMDFTGAEKKRKAKSKKPSLY